jgi:hypothetical protein
VAQEESPHKETKKPTVSIKQFAYRDEHDDDKVFWFLSINEAFTDPFWNEWVSAIDTMRFCIGLGGKKKTHPYDARLLSREQSLQRVEGSHITLYRCPHRQLFHCGFGLVTDSIRLDDNWHCPFFINIWHRIL